MLPASLAALSARRRVDVFVDGQTGWVRHPARLRAQHHLGAPFYQRVYRFEFRASSAVSAPGPHPTSRTRPSSGSPAKSAKGTASGLE